MADKGNAAANVDVVDGSFDPGQAGSKSEPILSDWRFQVVEEGEEDDWKGQQNMATCLPTSMSFILARLRTSSEWAFI